MSTTLPVGKWYASLSVNAVIRAEWVRKWGNHHSELCVIRSSLSSTSISCSFLPPSGTSAELLEQLGVAHVKVCNTVTTDVGWL